VTDNRFMVSVNAIIEDPKVHPVVFQRFSDLAEEFAGRFSIGVSSTLLDQVGEEDPTLVEKVRTALSEARFTSEDIHLIFMAIHLAGAVLEEK
jgi:hypothetical protein